MDLEYIKEQASISIYIYTGREKKDVKEKKKAKTFEEEELVLTPRSAGGS